MGMSPFQRKCAATLPVIVLAALSLACADDALDAALDAGGGSPDGATSDAKRGDAEAGVDPPAGGKMKADGGADGAPVDGGNDVSATLAARVAEGSADARDAGAKADDASPDAPEDARWWKRPDDDRHGAPAVGARAHGSGFSALTASRYR